MGADQSKRLSADDRRRIHDTLGEFFNSPAPPLSSDDFDKRFQQITMFEGREYRLTDGTSLVYGIYGPWTSLQPGAKL